MESIVLGGGCFWCIEAVYQRVKGVESVESGYAGGDFEDPSYEQLHELDTGHAEVVKVTFDPSIVQLETILEIFWHVHDPTTPNRQGADVGPQYRSVILYGDDQLTTVNQSVESVAKQIWDDPIVTEIIPLDRFYKAEEYHQDYFNKNPNNMYCQVVINPKISEFSEKFADLLR